MPLLISDVARISGLSIHTLRYYDERGLLPQVQRAENGHRIFDEEDLNWIDIIKCLRSTEMPLSEMQHFAELVQQGPLTASQRRALLESHRHKVERRMHEIQEALARIDDKIERYRLIEQEQDSDYAAEGENDG